MLCLWGGSSCQGRGEESVTKSNIPMNEGWREGKRWRVRKAAEWCVVREAPLVCCSSMEHISGEAASPAEVVFWQVQGPPPAEAV